MTAPTNPPELLSFPCDFPVKVLGRTGDEFRAHARDIVERHMGALAPGQVTERLSRDGNFLAITYNLTPQNREQLDNLYRELSASETVVMAL